MIQRIHRKLKDRRRKKTTIYMELLKLLIVAFLVSFAFLVIINRVTGGIVDDYYDDINYEKRETDRYARQFQRYVSRNDLKSNDSKKLDRWVMKKRVLLIAVYKDGKIVYNCSGVSASALKDQDDWSEKPYRLQFADGKASVYIQGVYPYELYYYAEIVSIVLTFIVFFVIVLGGIRKRMKYIRQLSRDIKILENGNLDYEIQASGRDELYELAVGLDDMRKSLKRQFKVRNDIMKANSKMVTEMSHDIRTPLTSIMLYSEILRSGKCRDEAQFQSYLEKIDQKTKQLKVMSDRLFNYALINVDQEVKLEKRGTLQDIFFDPLSEMCGYLEQRGFEIKPVFLFQDTEFDVHEAYVARIIDNVTSNIVKYADSAFPVIIRSVYNGDACGIEIENRVKEHAEGEESTKIGLSNIRKMMEKMGGKCHIDERDGSFIMTLLFRSDERQK